MKIKEYPKDDVVVLWKPELCYHSEKCVKGLPQVFNQNNRPWIDLSQAEKDEIVAQVRKCPSGALSIKGDSTSEIDVSNTKVNISQNGPYIVKGSFKVFDPEGTEISVKGKAALCRCGYSANKPFCDGSHAKHNFQG
jgi:uncharacterized Fe-S cluster protein YjdI